MKHTSLLLPAVLLLLPLNPHVSADETADHQDQVRRTTAVALNYCRASLHRIRRQPEKPVLLEEQQRILNNLDLNRIEDPEVIELYKSVLEEISTVEISDREREVIHEQFRRAVHRQLGTSFFVVGAQLATGQLGSAFQSGANSWWDYRNQEVRRDSDQWNVERKEFTSLMSRSGAFLDSFWRLSQKNNIPDRWLIRDDDLDQLGRILAERDAEQRLRMLGRMERFMECYPPYWYYVARTQQQLGHTEDALQTYQRLSQIGQGHFRQDDMLATSMANMALLQQLHGDTRAADTAFLVPNYSIRNWEANLIAAWVLGQHKRFTHAEELILCNLDEDQEPGQSRVALVSLYYHSGEKQKLAALLDDPQIVRDVPIPGLLLSCRLLAGNVPPAAQQYLASSLSAFGRSSGRRGTVSLSASPAWKLQDAQARLSSGMTEFQTIGCRTAPHGVHAEFAVDSERDTETAVADAESLKMTLTYPATPAIHVTLTPRSLPSRQNERPAPAPSGSSFLSSVNNRLPLFQTPREMRFQISEIEFDGVRLSLRDTPEAPATDKTNDLSGDARRDVSIEETEAAVRF
ncbi:MAG: tetratricopeptide repeat protein [Planctomycetaceae bacterium]|nr:tetratricopeptide repeat protein [Planctomycetaceae bacterium]